MSFPKRAVLAGAAVVALSMAVVAQPKIYWGDDVPKCIELLSEKLLPKLNLFGYGQVESPYGSGEFYEYVHEMLGERPNVVCSRIPDRDAILGSIKEFLGTGR